MPTAVSEGAAEQDLTHAVGMLRAGATPSETWERLGWDTDPQGLPQLPDAALRDAVHAGCRLSHHCGASLASVLGAVAEYAQARARVRQDIAAAVEGPRISAVVLQWLPLGGLGLASLINPAVVTLVFATALGWVLLTLAAAVTWAGRRWSARLIASAGNAGDREALAMMLVITLVRAALASGVDVTGALRHVGQALASPVGAAVAAVATRLEQTGQWEAAWDGESDLASLERTLRHAWLHGMDPDALCESTQVALRLQAIGQARRAVARLTVSLSFPLTLCFLPAFGLVGVLPLVLAVARTAAITLV